MAIEEDGEEKEILVPRWKCERKGDVLRCSDRTFSLLPHPLVPYRRYSAAVHYQAFKHAARGGTDAALDALQAVLNNLCGRSIAFMVVLFQAAFFLLVQAEFLQRTDSWQESLVNLVESYEGGLGALMIAFYAAEHEFLLGTPSQHRRRGKKHKRS